MVAYIEELKRYAAAHAQKVPPKKQNLRERFLDWYQGLPQFVRHRPFSMSEFETALKTQGKHLSPVLLELGWRRKRIWSTTGRYHRFWEAPDV